jgi:hypothetical protein
MASKLNGKPPYYQTVHIDLPEEHGEAPNAQGFREQRHQ